MQFLGLAVKAFPDESVDMIDRMITDQFICRLCGRLNMPTPNQKNTEKNIII